MLMWTQILYVFYPTERTYKFTHAVHYTALKVKPFELVPDSFCHPLTLYSDGADKTPVRLTHSPPEQRHSLSNWNRIWQDASPCCSEHLTSVCWYQMWRSSRESRSELWVKTWQRHRLRPICGVGTLTNWYTRDYYGQYLIFLCFFFCFCFFLQDRLSPLCLVLLTFSWPMNSLFLTHSNHWNLFNSILLI